MKLFNRRELKLYCFSPPVMLATFAIEIALALWVVFRYKLNETGRIAVVLLVCLALFQIAEYNVCEAGWLESLLASRIGYIAITLLPPLGIHLAYAIAKAKHRPLLAPAYISAAAFVLFFMAVGNSLTGHACLGNYVIFQTAPEATWLYALYYYGWLIAGIWLCFRLQKKPALRTALTGLAIGYVAFMLPTTTVNLIEHSTIEGIPSIMCGFAVLLALTLAFWVMPQAGKKR